MKRAGSHSLWAPLELSGAGRGLAGSGRTKTESMVDRRHGTGHEGPGTRQQAGGAPGSGK